MRRWVYLALIFGTVFLAAGVAEARLKICYKYEEVNVPDGMGGKLYTSWWGINDRGQVSGNYCITPTCAPTASGAIVGGVIHDRKRKTFDVFPPPAPHNWVGTVAVNNNGVAAGQALSLDPSTYTYTAAVAFIRYPSGKLVILPPPKEGVTVYMANDINDSGDIVGGFDDPAQGNRRLGFVWKKGKYRIYDLGPTADRIHLTGINNSGVIAGNATMKNGDLNAIVDHGKGPVFVAYPGAAATRVNGMNDRVQMVGYYQQTAGAPTIGLVKKRLTGFQDILFPGASYNTEAGDINNFGTIAGTFDYWSWGFIARPYLCR